MTINCNLRSSNIALLSQKTQLVKFWQSSTAC